MQVGDHEQMIQYDWLHSQIKKSDKNDIYIICVMYVG